MVLPKNRPSICRRASVPKNRLTGSERGTTSTYNAGTNSFSTKHTGQVWELTPVKAQTGGWDLYKLDGRLVKKGGDGDFVDTDELLDDRASLQRGNQANELTGLDTPTEEGDDGTLDIRRRRTPLPVDWSRDDRRRPRLRVCVRRVGPPGAGW